MKALETDVLVIGTGISGCTAALELADQGISVLMITRSARPEDTASFWAQGGIAYKAQDGDREKLQIDIEKAGAGVCYQKAVKLLAQEGPKLVEKYLFERLNVPFDQNKDGTPSLTEEGAHSSPRVLHVGDETGKEMQTAFLREVDQHKNITVLTQHSAVDLLTLSHHSTDSQDMYKPPRCVGAYVLDRQKSQVIKIMSKETVLATGGLGQLYLHTTNPGGARGDGLAMAYRTGARIMNLEYIQFHPTALYRKTSDRFLITEALRGEGAKLLNHAGEEFMNQYDSRGELASRDVVARAIHDEMLREGTHWMYLDISHKPADWLKKRFPAVYAECKRHGIDITQQPIPVVPAAHYSCGGVAVDLNGSTTIQNLKAVGEIACTGVHGANRLASTSLLEDLVWGVQAAKDIQKNLKEFLYDFPKIQPWQAQHEPVEADLVLQDWLTIKHTMWNYVGLIRTPKRLARAQRILRELADEVERFYALAELSDELIGLRNGITCAQLILTAARRNHQSLGSHFIRTD